MLQIVLFILKRLATTAVIEVLRTSVTHLQDRNDNVVSPVEAGVVTQIADMAATSLAGVVVDKASDLADKYHANRHK